jgi:uncharacterized membrane protein
VGDAFSYAFTKFKENWGPLVLITLLLLVGVGLIQGIGNLITNGLVSTPTVDSDGTISGGFFGAAMILSLLFSALSWVVQLIIQSGIIKGVLGLTRGEKFDIGSVFNGINFGQVIIASLIIGVATFIGLILCILPGIVVIFLTWWTLYFIIDRGQDAVTAIKSSIDMVSKNVGSLILLFLASVAAYIVGACLCGVGLLAAIPIVVIAQVYTFRTLNGDPVTA